MTSIEALLLNFSRFKKRLPFLDIKCCCNSIYLWKHSSSPTPSSTFIVFYGELPVLFQTFNFVVYFEKSQKVSPLSNEQLWLNRILSLTGKALRELPKMNHLFFVLFRVNLQADKRTNRQTNQRWQKPPWQKVKITAVKFSHDRAWLVCAIKHSWDEIVKGCGTE